MSKRLTFILFCLVLVFFLASACDSEIKMANRGEYQGPATLTPFLPKATFTSEGLPADRVEAADGAGSTLTVTNRPEAEVSGTGTSVIDQSSTTPAVSESPDETPLASTASQTSTPSPSSVQSSPSDTPQFATETVLPAATTAPENTPVPSSTSTLENAPLPTSTIIASNTPAPSNTPLPAGCSPSGNESYESQVINLINQERASRGLSALSINSSLRQAARGHSEDMACNDFFSHTGSDGSTMSSRIIAAGYSYSWAAENIAASSSCGFSPSSVVSMWMNSAGHKANILSAYAVHIGVGFRCVNDGTSGDLDAYYTADFGAP